MPTATKRITVPQFTGFKAEGQKISVLTAYDCTMARLLAAKEVIDELDGKSSSSGK